MCFDLGRKLVQQGRLQEVERRSRIGQQPQCLGSASVVTAARSPGGQDSGDPFDLRVEEDSVRRIEHRTDLRVIKAVFELRTMSECGFMPQIVCCRDCGTYDEGDAFYLDAQEGHLLCASCAAKAGKNCNLDKAALFALRHICLVEDKKIFAFKISVGSLEKLSAVAENYALTHLDKPLKSYAFLKSVLP